MNPVIPSEFVDLVARRPWADRTREEPFEAPFGMLGRNETLLLYDLAKEWYRREGLIVDAGCYLGRSASSFGHGLQDNAFVTDKAGAIHCFDLFRADPPGAALLRGRGIDIRVGDSVRAIFDENTHDVAECLRVFEGDFLTMEWPAEPIELLFVDVAKNQALHDRIVDVFYRQLIPGRSLVIHQDYHNPFLPWIHIGMEFLAPYFEILEPRINNTALFLNTAPIPDEALRRLAAFDFDEDEQLDLMERQIARLPADCRHYPMLARIKLLERMGRSEAVDAACEELSGLAPPDLWDNDAANWQHRVDLLRQQIEFDRARHAFVDGDYERALAMAGRIVDMDGAKVDASSLYAVALLALGRDPDERPPGPDVRIDELRAQRAFEVGAAGERELALLRDGGVAELSNYYRSLLARAKACMVADEVVQAESLLRRIPPGVPIQEFALALRCRILRTSGRSEEAGQLARDGVESFPDSPRLWLENVHTALACADYGRAMQGAERTADIARTAGVTLGPHECLALARAFGWGGKLDVAGEWLDRALAIEPENALFHAHKAWWHHMAGLEADARKCLATALGLDASCPSAIELRTVLGA